ncbi:MAG: hypothetical protein ACI3XA_09230 [Clostridia bacterium]
MKNIKKNDLVKIAVAVILVVALVAVMKECFSKKGVMIASDSEIGVTNKYVYYNDTKNNVYKMDLSTEESEIFIEDCKLLDARDDEVLVIEENYLAVLDGETAEVLHEYDGINTNDAVLTSNYIYFKSAFDNRLCRASRETEMVEVIPMMENIEVDNFDIYFETDIFFSANTGRIVRYNPETMLMRTYAEEVNVGDFSANDGYVLYTDKDDDYILYSRDLEQASVVSFEDIKTNKFKFKNGKVFYIENTEKNKDKYELKIFNGHSH